MVGLHVLIASAVNPILTVFLVAAPFLPSKASGPWEFWGRSGVGLGVAVILAESGKHFQVWPGHPSFPSGHETYGLCVAASLAIRDWRWLALGLPLTALLAWALIAAHFHYPVDVAGAVLVGPPCALLFHLLKRRSGPPVVKP